MENGFPLGVSELLRSVRDVLERRFPLVWVKGELSNLSRASSGHLYFTLKDRGAQVECVMFRSRAAALGWEPREGAQVEARALVSLYEPRGEFQLVVEHLEEAGEGALRRQFELLKAKLQREGLFESARKRPLPALPRRIGIVTSPTGAALRDILNIARRRFPAVRLLIYPVPVQGGAAVDLPRRSRDSARRCG